MCISRRHKTPHRTWQEHVTQGRKVASSVSRRIDAHTQHRGGGRSGGRGWRLDDVPRGEVDDGTTLCQVPLLLVRWVDALRLRMHPSAHVSRYTWRCVGKKQF